MSYVTIRIWEETRRLLRLIAADSGEQMVEVLHRLCEDEWRRIQSQNVATNVARNPDRGDIPHPNAE